MREETYLSLDMIHFYGKLLLGISLISCVVSRKYYEEDINTTFMTKVKNCSGLFLESPPVKHKYVENLNISYLLFTRENPQNPYYLQPNRTSIANSTFNPCVTTILLIHGFHVTIVKSNGFFEIKDELLKQSEYNVIVVDWSKYDYKSYFAETFSYVPLVGSNVAEIIKELMNTAGIRPENVYLVGHSLGAHVAGFVGKIIPNLGRISGLDAAGPLFRFLPDSLRLCASDALFVDAIHTNGGLIILAGLGLLLPFADQDYYPNGGSYQPGCKMGAKFFDTENYLKVVESTVSLMTCNHDRVLKYFQESINNCEFIAVLCDSFERARTGNCLVTPVNARMGFHARPIKGLPIKSTFYLQTGEKSPFCSN